MRAEGDDRHAASDGGGNARAPIYAAGGGVDERDGWRGGVVGERAGEVIGTAHGAGGVAGMLERVRHLDGEEEVAVEQQRGLRRLRLARLVRLVCHRPCLLSSRGTLIVRPLVDGVLE